jgi:hypothetical protein
MELASQNHRGCLVKVSLAYVFFAVCILFYASAMLVFASAEMTGCKMPDGSEIQPGVIRGRVFLDNIEMTPSGIIVEDEQGNTYRALTNLFGGYNLQLDPGEYTLTFEHGAEYSTQTVQVMAKSYAISKQEDVNLKRLIDPSRYQWFSGDLHQHSYYSDGLSDVQELIMANLASGLQFAFLSDHNTALGLDEWHQGNSLVFELREGGTAAFHAYGAIEVTTEFGHYQAIGCNTMPAEEWIGFTAEERKLDDSLKDAAIKTKIEGIAQAIHAQGGIAQINHPYSPNTMGFHWWEDVNLFDTMEIWNGMFVPPDGRYEHAEAAYQTQNYRSKLTWFELLNKVGDGGKFIAATCGTDIHDIEGHYLNNQAEPQDSRINYYKKLDASQGKYNGAPSLYIHVEGPQTKDHVLQSIKNGNSFLSRGVLLFAYADGKSFGETVTLQTGSVDIDVELFCRDGLESLWVVQNGRRVWETAFDGAMREKVTIPLLDVSPGDWVVLESCGKDANYAISNPIFFQ